VKSKVGFIADRLALKLEQTIASFDAGFFGGRAWCEAGDDEFGGLAGLDAEGEAEARRLRSGRVFERLRR